MCHLQQRFSPQASAQEHGLTPQGTPVISTGLSSSPYLFKLHFSPIFSTTSTSQLQQSVTERQTWRHKYPCAHDLHEHWHTTHTQYYKSPTPFPTGKGNKSKLHPTTNQETNTMFLKRGTTLWGEVFHWGILPAATSKFLIHKVKIQFCRKSKQSRWVS